MKHSGHLNPSEETGTGCPVTSKYGMAPPNKHGGVGRQQQHCGVVNRTDICYSFYVRIYFQSTLFIVFIYFNSIIIFYVYYFVRSMCE